MNNFGNQLQLPSQVGVRPTTQLSAGFLSQAFTWMFAGLLLTAGITYLVQSDSRVYSAAANLFMPALLLELGVVFGISLLIRRISAIVALGLFFVYAALNGLTIGLIVSAYTTASVATAFLSAAGMFGAAAVYGAVTKRSLASMGGFLFMALIGLIIAMVLNLFFANGVLSLLISVAGVVIFTGLTAYDTQRIARGDYAAGLGSMEKGAVFGALRLYLDFINLFLMFLRLSGSRR
ncbi:MAG TPA: Bax inhibitor-1/YccA family protein [Candidatus Saccharimonadales bacterium]|nr:Bax inhibitor-1/YccA family protein [Candidatus Saccharimonadales bacterium]